MGGTLSVLASRVAVLSSYMGCNLSIEEILEDFRAFYFETALSSDMLNLQTMEAFAPPDCLVFGTDLPGELESLRKLKAYIEYKGIINTAVDLKSAGWFTDRLKAYCTQDPAKLRRIMYENALRLFPSKASCLAQIN